MAFLNQGKEIFYKKWWDVGITRIRDVLYEFKEGFFTIAVCNRCNGRGKEDFNKKEIRNKYEVIKEAIPKEWIKRIENMEEEKQEKEVFVKLEKNCMLLKNVR